MMPQALMPVVPGWRRQARYFPIKTTAQRFAFTMRVELLNEGSKQDEIADEERHAILKTRSLQCSLKEALAEFLSDRIDRRSPAPRCEDLRWISFVASPRSQLF
jgi:hypothetical protein